MLLDWYPDAADSQHSTVVLTLNEAESPRRLIWARNKGAETACPVGLRLHCFFLLEMLVWMLARTTLGPW